MSLGAWLELIASGVITGGIYALVALGLNLQYGLMRILNIAHGEFLMIGAFLAWALSSYLGVDPLISLPFAALAVFGVGALTYRVSIRHVLLAPELNQMLLTFGLGILLQNLALIWLGGNTRTVTTGYQGSSLSLRNSAWAAPKRTRSGWQC